MGRRVFGTLDWWFFEQRHSLRSSFAAHAYSEPEKHTKQPQTPINNFTKYMLMLVLTNAGVDLSWSDNFPIWCSTHVAEVKMVESSRKLSGKKLKTVETCWKKTTHLYRFTICPSSYIVSGSVENDISLNVTKSPIKDISFFSKLWSWWRNLIWS